MPLEMYPYIHTDRTNADLIRSDYKEMAPPNEFIVEKVDSSGTEVIPTKFQFTDTWGGHNTSAEEGEVMIGQGILVGVEDTDYNIAPVINAGTDTYPGAHPFEPPVPIFDQARHTRLVIADADDAGKIPIGMLRGHAYENISERHSGSNPTVNINSHIELPYVDRATAEVMQLGCITNGVSGGSVSALVAGDCVRVGEATEATDGTGTWDLSGKFVKMQATDDFRYMVGRVWSVKRNISIRGWLDKVVLGFLDYERAKAFYTNPTTAELSQNYVEYNSYKYPGPVLPTGGVGRGIYTMTAGENYAATMQVTYTLTAADVAQGAGVDTFDVQIPIFRFFDNGDYIGAVDTTAGVTLTAVSETNAGATAAASATATVAGVVTVTEGASPDFTEGDVITISVTALGQLPGVPVNFTPTMGTGIPVAGTDVTTGSVVTVGLALVQLTF